MTPASVSVTFFADHVAATKREERLTLAELADMIRSATASSKEKLPWLKMATFGDRLSENGSLRYDRNLTRLVGIEGDCDLETVSFDEAVEIAEKIGLCALIYTSPSHTPDKSRWRILALLSREHPPAARTRLMARLSGLYRGIFSIESWTLSQAYYYGSVANNPEHRVEVIEGLCLDELDELDLIAIGKPNGSARQPHKAKKPNGSAGHSGDGIFPFFARPVFDEAAAIAQIASGDAYHTACIQLAGRWAHDGVPFADALGRLRGIFEEVPADRRDQRWRVRYADITRCVDDIYRKEAGKAEDNAAEAPQPNGKGHPSPSTLALVDPVTLSGVAVPPRRWLVPLWVPLGRATGLYGAPGEGKTLLAQMLATACAIGALWLGLPVRRCNSLLMFCEDDLDEMHRRQEDINRAYGCTFADLGAMRWLPRLGDDNTLMVFDNGRASHTKLFHDLLSAAKDHQAELVIEDTLADVFAGNENDRGQARRFTQEALGLLARETQGAVVALAHPSRAGINSGSGESGSTGWVGAFRSFLYMSTPLAPGETEPADPDKRLLTRRKANAARRGEQIELRWTDGVFVPTRPPATGMPDSVELLRTAESVFLDLLAKTTAEGQYLSHNSRSGNYAPRVFTKRPDRGRFNKDSFERAMQTLFAARAIEIVPRKAGDRHSYDVLRVAAAVPESDVAGAASDAGDAKSGATAFTDCAEREGADNVKSDATGTAADGARTVPKARTRKARVRAVRATAARGAGGAGGC